MANATSAEDFPCNNNCDDFNVLEFSNIIEDSILVSLLEDSQVEDGDDDDERLRFVIQSLEAEIINPDSCLEKSEGPDHQDYVRFCDAEYSSQLDSCSTSPDHYLELDWIDMEMDYATLSNEINGYYSIENMMDNMVELGTGTREHYFWGSLSRRSTPEPRIRFDLVRDLWPNLLDISMRHRGGDIEKTSCVERARSSQGNVWEAWDLDTCRI